MANDVLTNNIKHLLGSLVAQGVHNFVVSPGSRTTPIALLIAEMQATQSDVQVTIDVDERSAAFFALGMAKNTQEPVALLATSGTATANYLPAIMEAHISHIPLVVLTTDRPAELQQIGAPQTVEQTKMYGDNVKVFVDVPLQDAHADMTDYIDYHVQNVTALAKTTPAGPVQINVPLRKPLMPDLGLTWPTVTPRVYEAGVTHVSADMLGQVATALRADKALILAGPDEVNWDATQFEQLAAHYQTPILADVLSNLRPSDFAINGIDALLEADALPAALTPQMVLRFGGTPVSARVVSWLRQLNIPVVQVGMNHAGHDHTRHTQTTLAVDEMALIADLLTQPGTTDSRYLAAWQAIKQEVATITQTPTTLSELALPAALSALPTDSQIFIANSMPIRDMDNYFMPKHAVRALANRGANGIDGTVSSAFGMAMNGHPTTLLTGDLTLFHDMNGLMLAHQAQLPLTVLVVNNQGGGIFSFLPQAAAKDYFEPMFGTPLPLAIDKIAGLYDAEYHHVADLAALTDLLQAPAKQLRIIEITSSRAANVTDHQALIQQIREAVHG